MVFLNKVIPPSQEVCQILRKAVKTNEPPSKEDIQKMYGMMKEVTKVEGERLFIVMTAQTKGWQFARELNFYEEGTKLEDNCIAYFDRN